MSSNIDTAKPTAVSATTQSVRDNFSAAKTEIEVLQVSVSALESFQTSVNAVVGSLSTTVSSNYATLVSAVASVSVRTDGVSAALTSVNGAVLHDTGANGFVIRTAATSTVARSIAGTTGEVSVNNGDGVAANVSISLPASITFTGKTLSGGTVSATTLTAPVLTNYIGFPAAQSASSGANDLDDYEEGTWTPADNSGAALTFSAAEGRYRKIGQIIVAQAHVIYPVTADGSNVSWSGLPYVSSAGAPSGGGFIAHTNAATYYSVFVVAGAATMSFYSTAGTSLINSTFSGKEQTIVFVYHANA